MPQYKARIEPAVSNWHAIEIWLQAPNILSAGQEILELMGPLAIDMSHVTKLIELSEKEINNVAQSQHSEPSRRRPRGY